jgi:cytochrome c-type biogenesis protein CcmH
MTAFLLSAAALLALGLGVLLWPLLHAGRAPGAASAASIVAMFRDKLRELDADRQSGSIDAAPYEQARRELERQLLDAVAGTAAPAPAAGAPARARWSAAFVGLFVLLLPVFLYLNLGAPGALVPGAIPPAAADGAGEGEGAGMKAPAITNAQVQKMIDDMKADVAKNPRKVETWTMLGRAYAYLHQYADAERALAVAVSLSPRDAHLLADLADMMAMSGGRHLDGEPLKLLDRALQIDPNEVKALALSGTAAFNRQDYKQAVYFWERALKVLPGDGEFAQTLRGSLDEARQLAGAGKGAPALAATPAAPAAGAAAGPPAAGPPVRGRVTLSAKLAAQARPGDTVFVFARATQGPRMPLAMLRRQVKDLPFEFALDDSMAMVPDLTVSKYSPVIVGARISRSGDAMAAAGDLQGFSQPVKAGAAGVQVVIDQVVH